MKILITGGSGMLGSALTDVLSGSTHDFLSCSHSECDITSTTSIQQVCRDFHPEVIINCAAYTAVDDAEEEIENAILINAEGVKNLASFCEDKGITLVHISTDYVFGGGASPQTSYIETDIRSPINAYGRSKAMGEEYIENLMSSTPWYICRTAWLYGPGGKNFVDTMKTLADKLEELRIVDDQHGSPTFTYDLAEAVVKLLDNNYSQGVYNLTNEGSCTWFEFANEIFKISSLTVTTLPVGTEEFTRPAKRPMYSILENTKGPKLRDWKVALEDYLNNYSS